MPEFQLINLDIEVYSKEKFMLRKKARTKYMFPIVRTTGAKIISKLRFIAATICILLFATSDSGSTASNILTVALLLCCIITAYLLPSFITRHMCQVYFCLCGIFIAGTLMGIKSLSLLSSLPLVLFVMCLKDGGKASRVLLISLPALVTTIIMKDWASILQLGLSLCTIVFFGDDGLEHIDLKDDNEVGTTMQHHKNRGRLVSVAILAVTASLIIRTAIQMYGNNVDAPTSLVTRIIAFLLAHFSIHISLHTYMLFNDIDGGISKGTYRVFAGAATLTATSLLIIISNTPAWINRPYLVGMAILLTHTFQCYEECLQASIKSNDE